MADSTKPRVILGLMTYGPETCKDCRITSMTEFQHHLDMFQKTHGYNEIDTARIYASGEQERFTAEAGWKERGFELATKSYPQIPGAHRPANLRKDLETSLSELGAEQVDIFYLHAADRSVPFTETLKEVNMLYKEGKFKKLGLSNYSAYEVAEIVMICSARGWVRPTIYQGVYNAIARNLETEVIPACHRYGLDVVIYNPLCGGLLTGRYTSATGDCSGRYDTNTFLGPIYRSMYFNENNFRAIDKIRAAAGKHGLSMTEVALRWCVHHSALKPAQKGGLDGVIIGVSRAEQLSQNITDLWKDPLPKEVVEALDTAWVIAKGTSPNPWHTPLVYTYDAKNALFDE
ncbi:NADP-dependent oxidoreductase domain-containing protein [Talaromyces proteolyticus]|uniref:NADP-dependent oxidoreductase domain-containing protein n=1 Tax=Talaromyces proteolyticus TaxID=1131652 RepID=A0AAD4L1T7_9EURO|nr:NADP-dependent oxidoreductase domain-containing protein [Talaromyces proteolyticus]KAH8702551.1 NADP-dependent oxidoreductase domain-containing protein [Talaromyces proteolyticus]